MDVASSTTTNCNMMRRPSKRITMSCFILLFNFFLGVSCTWLAPSHHRSCQRPTRTLHRKGRPPAIWRHPPHGSASETHSWSCRQAMAITQVQLKLQRHSFRSVIVRHRIWFDHHLPVRRLNCHLVLFPGHEWADIVNKVAMNR
jgi:hypothetical protein